jgi:hypothetical protein
VNSKGSGARPSYSVRPVPRKSRLLRTANREGALGGPNASGVPYPGRGRRAWLERLAAARYDPTKIGWKSHKR